MTKSQLEALLQKQKSAFLANPPDFQKRKNTLKRLSDLIEENKEKLIEAMSADFGLRAHEETLLLELFPLQDEIKFAVKNMKSWVKKKYVSSPWFLMPSKAYYQYQPLGSVGIMGAWNYQILLTLSPLVDALAAGNHAILKPSEMAPKTADIIKELINQNFPEEYIHCVTGDAELAKDFSSLPWNHLFFTGSTAVGKKIMAAAAPHLTPVTLELGGKSPAIIHESYSLERAIKRLITGKLFNAGQTCVAPDYLIIPKSLNESFEKQTSEIVEAFYPNIDENRQYSHIISDKHFQRLEALVKDAREKGARIVELFPNFEQGEKNKLMTPKIIFNVSEDMEIMKEEIFGPVLPVVNLESIEEASAYINNKPKPLALYYFDNNQKRIDWLLKHTISGGVTVNGTIYHLAQHNLPFGGVGESGMGHYHGFDGFKTFSKKRAVMQQMNFASTDMLRPPFTGFKLKLIKIMGKLSKI